MKQKIAAFMMGLGLLLGGFGLVSAQQNGNSNGNAPSWFGLNESYTQGFVGVPGAGQNKGDGLIGVIKMAINRVLGILGLITFVLLLWGGFQMVTAAGDDKKFGAGQTILKQAGIGLLFIAGSWLMVSMIFWLIWVITK